MKKKKKSKRIIDILDYLIIPTKWFDRQFNKPFILFALLFCGIGIVLCQYYRFPYVKFYVCMLSGIVLMVIASIKYYIKTMPKIITFITLASNQHPANSFYYKYVYKNIIYTAFPTAIVIIFGCGGILMFSPVLIDILFIWVMILFSIVVYISIIGYIQYIFLAVYIYKIACSKSALLNFQHSLRECIPADLEWIQLLTKLCHIYRSAFFTIGSMYIIAFGAFCYLPEFGAKCNSSTYYILWSIILIAIVIVFPIISILEHFWIKKIVRKIKDIYISDLKKETSYLKKAYRRVEVTSIQAFFLENIYAFKIMESRDYPITSIWNVGYSILLAMFNFLATVITILQGIPMISNGFHQIF